LLKFFEYEGCFPQHSSEVPDALIGYLAEQLSVPKEAFNQYDWQGPSIPQHRARIRQWFNFRPYIEDDRQAIINWLTSTILPENQNTEFLIDAVLKHLRGNHIEPPSKASVERIIRSAVRTYEKQLFDMVCGKLPVDTRLALDALLKPIKSSTDDAIVNIPLYQIRTCQVKSSLNSVLQAATQLQQLQQLNLPTDLFSSLSPKVVQRFRQRAAVEAPSQLCRHPDPIRYTLLAAFCLCRQAEITDELIESLIILVHKMGAKAERKVIQELIEDIKRVGGKHSLLFAIAEVALSNPDGTVKEVIYPVASEQTLKDLVLESRSSGPAYRYRIHTVMRNSYSKHYRRMLPTLLRVLDFHTNNTVHQPVIEAIQLLKDYLDHRQIYYPTDEVVPVDGVVRPLLSPVVDEEGKFIASDSPKMAKFGRERSKSKGGTIMGQSLTATEILQKMNQALGKIQDIKFTSENTYAKSRSKDIWVYEFKMPDKYRIEMKNLVVISDGVKRWSYRPEWDKRLITVSKAASEGESLGIYLNELIRLPQADFTEKYSVQSEGLQKIDGKEVIALRFNEQSSRAAEII